MAYCYRLHKSVLELNEGQKEGLPKNPRYIRDEKFAKLKMSLEKSPEFLEANPLKVYPLDNGHYIVIDGNMRFLAGSEIGIEEWPCYIFKKETPNEKLMEYIAKSNTAYGNWDYDALGNDGWDVGSLEEWGMDVDFLRQDEWEDLPQVTEELDDPVLEKPTKIVVVIPIDLKEQEDEIKEAVKEAVAAYEGVKIE